eukprot:COSAG01_NODE_21269_length_910_cov_1.648582_1_plen_52_part_10
MPTRVDGRVRAPSPPIRPGSNGYLYKTFDSAAPRAQFKGIVRGELIRLIKRN